MSCPLHSNDNSCAGCTKVKIQRLQRQLSKREDDYRKLRERSDEQIETLERQLAEAREENEKLYQENISITRFYTDLCDRLPKGSCEILGHGWYNVEKYIKRRNENTVIKQLNEKGDE